MTASESRRDLALLLVVFASGSSGLAWEVLWQHHTSLAFGVSSYGTAVTLAALMAGLGLGGLLAAELARRGHLARPLAAYGVAEIVIGVGALAVPWGLAAFSALDTAVYLQAPTAAGVLRLAGTVLVLLVPATAMGTTIPLLASYVEGRRVSIALVYACNLFGAVGGVLVATFLLLPLIGVLQTSLVAAAMNLVVALWSFQKQGALQRQKAIRGQSREPASTAPSVGEPPVRPPSADPPPRAALGLAFLSGFVIFVLEVTWFRSLRAALQSTTESFALILAAFLIALTLGGALADRLRWRFPRRRFPAALERLLPLAGVAVLLATPLVDSLDRWTAQTADWLPEAFSWTTALERLAWLLLPLGPPVVLLGLIFPWLLARHATTTGTGRLYAVNTLGAVSGALAAGFVLVPWIGSTRTSWLAGVIVLVAAVLVDRTLRSMATAIVAGVFGLTVAWQYSDHAARHRVQGDRSEVYDEVRYVAEGPDSTVWVARDQFTGTLDLVIDGFAASGETEGANYMQWMGHLPALATPKLDEALVICFGTGQTANAVRQHGPTSLHVVDVNAAVLRAADQFEANQGVLDDPAVETTVMDGRAFLRRRRDLLYDLVTLEPMPPNFAGSNNLYAREFYELIRERMEPRGVVAQWVPFHLLAPSHMRAIVTTFQEVFPQTRLWIDEVSKTGILVGALEPWRLRESAISLPLTSRQIEAGFVLDWEEVAALAASGSSITDDNQLLAYGFDRLRRVRGEGRDWTRQAGGRNLWIVYEYRHDGSRPLP